MARQQYAGFRGLDESANQVVNDQLALLKCHNFFPVSNGKRGSLRKRGGTTVLDFAGSSFDSMYGLFPVISGTTVYPGIFWEHDVNGITFSLTNSGTTLTRRSDVITSTSSSPYGRLDWAVAPNFTLVRIGDSSGNDDFTGKVTTTDVSALGGAAPSSAVGVATGAAGSLTGDYRYVITFYNSTTGWESSPSAISSTVSPSGQKINVSSIPSTADKYGVDKVRLYRTLLTNEEPFFRVVELSLGTTSYVDDIADASLGAVAPTSGDHNAPPVSGTATSIGAIEYHALRAWASKYTDVYYSHAFDGNDYQLEYFSDDRRLGFKHEVVGLKSSDSVGGLLAFHRPGLGISIVRGKTTEEFSISFFTEDYGTHYPRSICEHGSYLTFWAERGPVLYRNGQLVEEYSDAIQEKLERELSGYGITYVSTVWSAYHRQFFYTVSYFKSGPLYKTITYGIDPSTGLCSTHGFDYIADGDYSAVDSLSLSTFSATDSETYIAIHNDDVTSGVLKAFDNSVVTDDGSAFTAEAITGRIDPSLLQLGVSGGKRFLSIEYTHENPGDDADVTVSFVTDEKQPHIDAVTWRDLYQESGDSIAHFDQGLGRWAHLKIVDSSDTVDEDVIGSFVVNYMELFNRDGEAT